PIQTGESVQLRTGDENFADHWGFEVMACPPYWPREKGKVERAIGYIQRSFLEGREFRDLDALNAQLSVWLADVANVRRHGTLRDRPVDRFAADQTGMRPVAGRAACVAAEVTQRHVEEPGRSLPDPRSA
ncbi:MAG: transposase, partial [Armatimonadetes bacterium]